MLHPVDSRYLDTQGQCQTQAGNSEILHKGEAGYSANPSDWRITAVIGLLITHKQGMIICSLVAVMGISAKTQPLGFWEEVVNRLDNWREYPLNSVSEFAVVALVSDRCDSV